jgi:uncharacterized membrane protein YeaQ/YmgE (transglycosylase-associated protein family)
MDFIWTTVIGLVAGLMAKDHRQAPSGYWLPALLGIAGSTLGYLVGGWAGWFRSGQALGYVAAVIGASLVLAAFNTARQLRRR